MDHKPVGEGVQGNAHQAILRLAHMLFGKLIRIFLRESIHGNELMGMAIPTFEHPEGALRRYGLRQGLLSVSSIVLHCAASFFGRVSFPACSSACASALPASFSPTSSIIFRSEE